MADQCDTPVLIIGEVAPGLPARGVAVLREAGIRLPRQTNRRSDPY